MDLKESLDFIRKTIYKYLPEEEYRVFVYGSRADGTAEKWSDIDVGIVGKEKVPFRKLALIMDEVEESDIPYKVDIVDFTNASEGFKELALKRITKL